MNVEIIQNLLLLGALVFISVLASKITSKFGIPILLIFIFVGMIAGSEGVGQIYFEDAQLAQILGTISLVLILFSGGLSTKFNVVKSVIKEGIILSTLGVVISSAVAGVLVHFILDWSWSTSFLLGTIVSSTDAASVFGILKNKSLGLKPKVEALIELESGSNDPMAVFLTITLISLITGSTSYTVENLIFNLFSQMSLGVIFGWVLAHLIVKMINLLDLEAEGLYPVLTLAGSLCIYALTEYCGGNGFLSVYVSGMTMSGEKYFSKKTLTVFHDGFAWIMQCVMFLMLGLLVFPSELSKVILPGIIISIFLILVARPLSVLISTLFFKYSIKEVLFISWGGLRGAVPIILATYALVGKVPEARLIFNLVFFIVLTSMIIQGMSMGRMAKFLKVQMPLNSLGFVPFSSEAMHRDFISYDIGSRSKLIGKAILELKLPSDVLIVLINRKGNEFIPRGSTELEAGDQVICLTNQNHIAELDLLFRD